MPLWLPPPPLGGRATKVDLLYCQATMIGSAGKIPYTTPHPPIPPHQGISSNGLFFREAFKICFSCFN